VRQERYHDPARGRMTSLWSLRRVSLYGQTRFQRQIVAELCFIAQHAVLIAGKMTGLVIDWSPEKPRGFGMAQVNGE
jgi:hypothetical protein